MMYMLGKTGNSPLLLLWEKILQIGMYNSEGGKFNL